jgi:hypothetical protein
VVTVCSISGSSLLIRSSSGRGGTKAQVVEDKDFQFCELCHNLCAGAAGSGHGKILRELVNGDIESRESPTAGPIGR